MSEITEDWLASVGFKYREPGERQQFRHWTLTFSEQDDYGLYIETTMPGWINSSGDHVCADHGWFLWIGREHKFMHLRHVFEQSEIVTLVEALTGQPWVPTRAGHVPMKRRAPTVSSASEEPRPVLRAAITRELRSIVASAFTHPEALRKVKP